MQTLVPISVYLSLETVTKLLQNHAWKLVPAVQSAGPTTRATFHFPGPLTGPFVSNAPLIELRCTAIGEIKMDEDDEPTCETELVWSLFGVYPGVVVAMSALY